ncbi:MAG: adenylate/guanylate cyclase domain-containing protein [Bacteriovoracaceae bacterium]|nr:adenylate/guanylate cyclase domain-containing protein [Bacteroidota bacterium]
MTQKQERMSPSLKKLLFAKQFRSVVSAVVGITAAYFIAASTLGKVVELNALDIQFRIAQNSRQPDTNIVILTIDQNSLQYFKRTAKISWPWSRDFYALTTDYLTAAGAKAVVYDFQFTEPDEDRANSVGAYNDSLFAAAIRSAGNVYLAAILTKQEEEDQPGDPLVKFPSIESLVTETHRFEFDKSYSPLVQFQEAATSIGVVNFVPDEDGVCRRIALQYSYHGNRLFALSYNVYKDLFDKSHPIDTKIESPYLIYWYGKGGPDGVFKYYSIHSVIVSAFKEQAGMEPDVPASIFKDKIVFIGSNAPSLFDLKNTPFTYLEPYPGVEIHATAMSNYLKNDFIREVPFVWIFVLSLLLAACIAFSSNFYENIVVSTGIMLSISAVLFVIVTQLFLRELIWVQTVFPLFSIVLTYVISIGWNFATEGRNKRQIQRIFGQFVNPHVVKQLSADPERVELGGEEVEASIMFSDIEGFTSISESKKPKELVAFLNNYFSTANDIFFKHDGTIDKFIGDAVMVQFGIPLKNPNHRLLATRAAYEFSRVVFEMTKEAREKGEPVFSTRIGINSGSMVVGYIGGRSKKEYTVIGDTVNLASRLEGVNKYYGTSLMISESTATEQVTDEFLLREIDIMRVKGKKLPIKIFEVVCTRVEITEQRLKMVQTFEAGVKLYREQHWNDAISMFKTVLNQKSDDFASSMYIERCEVFRKHPPPNNWDGVYVMTSK